MDKYVIQRNKLFDAVASRPTTEEPLPSLMICILMGYYIQYNSERKTQIVTLPG